MHTQLVATLGDHTCTLLITPEDAMKLKSFFFFLISIQLHDCIYVYCNNYCVTVTD